MRPDPVLAWIQFPDRLIELEGRVIAYTDRAVLVEWGRGQGADCAWVWRDAVRPPNNEERPAPSKKGRGAS